MNHRRVEPHVVWNLVVEDLRLPVGPLLQPRLVEDDDDALAVAVSGTRVARVELEDKEIAAVMKDRVLVGRDPDAGALAGGWPGLMTTSRKRPAGAP